MFKEEQKMRADLQIFNRVNPAGRASVRRPDRCTQAACKEAALAAEPQAQYEE